MMFVCPVCKASLVSEHDALLCTGCRALWPLKNGVPDFRTSRGKYWGEYSEVVMDQLLIKTQEAGWRPALQEFFSQRDPGYLEYITDDGRANWAYGLSLPQGSRVLDAGCGWGTLSFSLAKLCKEVFALDIVSQRLGLVRQRCRDEKQENVFPVCGEINRLPFPDDFFDLVVLNGVLEWIPSVEEGSKPCASQLEALKEIFRVLKKGARLYLAIENRWAAINFLGFRDTHSGLRFVPILPRFLADIYSRLVRGKDFREYTYTYREYQALLKKSGFDNAVFYAPLPTYRRFQYMIPIENVSRVKFFIKTIVASRNRRQQFFVWLTGVFCLYRFVKYFVPDFSIVAFKGPSLKRSEDVSFLLHNDSVRATFFMFKDESQLTPDSVRKIYQRSSRGHLDRMVELWKKMDLCQDDIIKSSVPRLTRYEIIDGRCIMDEEYVCGESMEADAEALSLSWDSDFRDNLMRAAQWISLFHKNFVTGSMVIGSEHILFMKSAISKYINPDFVSAAAQDTTVPLVVAHRDFRPANIIKNKNRLTVIDWDQCVDNGFPLLDLLELVLRYFHSHHKAQKHSIHLDSRVFLKYLNAFYFQRSPASSSVKEAMSSYCMTFGLNEQQRGVLFLVWLYDVFYPGTRKGFL